jgi:hypothetical protein
MKKILYYSLLLLSIGMMWGCKKGNYPGAKASPYMSIFDIRNIYKGKEVSLNTDNMFGADKIAAVVVSDHSGGNLPAGMLVVQDSRRLGALRGISIPIGDAANEYTTGDSVIINVSGGVLKRENGILQLTGISSSAVTKVSSGITVEPHIVKANEVLASPELYESTYISIAKAGFDASVPAGSTYSGDYVINDGFGNITLHTEPGAEFANDPLPFLSNYSGILYLDENGAPQLWPRSKDDIMVVSATAPKIAPVVITGYLIDPSGTDANYEYIQLMATKNIDFSITPFSVVTTNNAGSATPTGFPANGWATGDLRTYKINLSTGTVQKGQYFYVGANKNIWGANSTDISSSTWFTKMYSTDPGDGFGTKTNNLLANSGNAGGIAVFDKTEVDAETIPVDVIFYGGNGSLYTAGPPEKGYRITNTDYYDTSNPTTLEDQPYYAMGSNKSKLAFSVATNFSQLGGTYNKTTGRWTTARTLHNLPLTATSVVSEIEGATTIEE